MSTALEVRSLGTGAVLQGVGSGMEIVALPCQLIAVALLQRRWCFAVVVLVSGCRPHQRSRCAYLAIVMMSPATIRPAMTIPSRSVVE